MLKAKHLLLLALTYINIHSQTTNGPQTHKKADLIIFSFDRPMQFYALLESVHKYITNLNQIYVLYRTSNEEYDAAYHEIKDNFPQIKCIKQGSQPRQDFKPLLLECFLSCQTEYIMFAVDDDIVNDYIDVSECINAIEQTDAYGFYLRAGTNIIKHYPDNLPLIVPPLIAVENNMFKFQFKDGSDVWGYPHNVDMTIFKKSQIVDFFKNAHYSSPNTLEGEWAGTANLNKYGLCFTVSKKFTLPLNIVQQDWLTPNNSSFSAQNLLSKWKNGLSIDIEPFSQVIPCSFLMNYTPTFIERKY